MIFRKNFVDFIGWSAGILVPTSRGSQACSLRIGRQLRHKLPDPDNRFLVIPDTIMGHAGNLIMRARAAERLVIDRLSGGTFNEISAAQSHERGAFDHDDDVRESGQISAAR